MSRINIPFVGASNKSRSVEVSTQRSVNLFPELDPLSGFQQALYLRPQLASFSTAGSATIRGMATFGSLLFVVSGGTVYSIDSSGSATSRGNLLTSTGRVSIDQNATQLMFVDGTAGYIWDGSTLTQIADGDFPNGATQVVQFDGYFVVNDPANPGRFYISAYNNGTAWDATEFATAERNPDGLLAMLVNERELWLWGEPRPKSGTTRALPTSRSSRSSPPSRNGASAPRSRRPRSTATSTGLPRRASCCGRPARAASASARTPSRRPSPAMPTSRMPSATASNGKGTSSTC
jgi:hypothetical protein